MRHPWLELLAIGPNHVWSRDITKLKGPDKWVYYNLYVIMDIFSRYTVDWMVAHRESATLAERLIEAICRKQGIEPNKLTIRADRGSSMTSRMVAHLLADMGITKTHSRPHVSNDNPYSEAQLKTMKYRPEFPDRFGFPEDARAFCAGFFSWYNIGHYHSGIGLMMPEMIRYGQAEEAWQRRKHVLMAAAAAHPERFLAKTLVPPMLPMAVWINKPQETPLATLI